MSASRLCVPAIIIFAIAVGAGGCGPNEGVTTYTVPTPARIDEGEIPPRAGDYRILGGVFPADEPAWFFKFTGKADEVAKFEPGFDLILKSVRFPKGIEEAPEFDTPAGWVNDGPQDVGGIRIVATLRPNPADANLKVTVTQSAGGLLGNLDRWAVSQLGGAKIRRAELPRITREIESGGVKGLRVDLRGPNDPGARKMPMAGRKPA